MRYFLMIVVFIVALTWTTHAADTQPVKPEQSDELIIKVYPVQDLLVEYPIESPQMDMWGGNGGYGNSNRGYQNQNRNRGYQNNNYRGDMYGNNNRFGNNPRMSDRKENTAGDELVALIREMVYPEVWRENGGTASIKLFKGNLVVRAPAYVHKAIQRG